MEAWRYIVSPMTFTSRAVSVSMGKLQSVVSIVVLLHPGGMEPHKSQWLRVSDGYDLTCSLQDDKGNSKGFGFVNFKEPEAAAKCVEALQGKEHKGKTLYAGRAQKKTERQAILKQKFDDVRAERIAKYQGMNLYVKNLADNMDDDDLRKEFSNSGTITSAKVCTAAWCIRSCCKHGTVSNVDGSWRMLGIGILQIEGWHQIMPAQQM